MSHFLRDLLALGFTRPQCHPPEREKGEEGNKDARKGMERQGGNKEKEDEEGKGKQEGWELHTIGTPSKNVGSV